MSIEFCPLYSGSSGNALFARSGHTSLLIDAGKSGKTILEAMARIGAAPESLNGLLVTHEHSDHIAGVGVLCRKLRIPVYATEGTWQGMASKIGAIPPELRRVIDPDGSFYVGDFEVTPFPIPHDARQPVGYRLWAGSCSIATATDLGYFPQSVRDAVAGSHLVLLESNHDPDMLRANPHYNTELKRRILSRSGHLSNETAADSVLALLEEGTRHIILGHLSGENNTPELALRVTREKAMSEGVDLETELHVDVALRDTVGSVYTITEQSFAERRRTL